jgi:hypothetical protein
MVFILDTSGSMSNDQPAVCDELIAWLDEVLPEIATLDARLLALGITDVALTPCAEGTVAEEFGNSVPGDPGFCPGPLYLEDWGPGTAIVADAFGWAEGALRAIVTVSDEGPCNGYPCHDPGNDRHSAANAIAVANDNVVVVYAVTGLGADGCVIDLADALAEGTGGEAFHREEGFEDTEIADSIADELARRLAWCNDLNGNLVPDDCEIPGDLDGDGMVGINDFLMLLARWGACPEPCPPMCTGDLDFDCHVGINDFLAMLAIWG